MTFHYMMALASLTLAASPWHAHAQTVGMPSAEERARIFEADADFTWGSETAWLGWRWTAPFQDFAGSVSVFYDPTSDGAPPGQPTRLRFIARQVERKAGEPDAVRWAESDACPALMRLMHELEALRAPPTVIAALTWPPKFPMIVLDGMGWTIWSRTAQQEGRFPAYVEMSSNSGEIAEWGRRSREALSECWSQEQPPQ